jgi:hypothetical protein
MVNTLTIDRNLDARPPDFSCYSWCGAAQLRTLKSILQPVREIYIGKAGNWRGMPRACDPGLPCKAGLLRRLSYGTTLKQLQHVKHPDNYDF